MVIVVRRCSCPAVLLSCQRLAFPLSPAASVVHLLPQFRVEDAEWVPGKSRNRLAPMLIEASTSTSDRRTYREVTVAFVLSSGCTSAPYRPGRRPQKCFGRLAVEGHRSYVMRACDERSLGVCRSRSLLRSLSLCGVPPTFSPRMSAPDQPGRHRLRRLLQSSRVLPAQPL
jgi:hypothetical protein